MSGTIVNLRLVRKAKARAQAEKKAEENRVTFGTPKALRKLNAAERKLEDKRHASGKLETTSGNGEG